MLIFIGIYFVFYYSEKTDDFIYLSDKYISQNEQDENIVLPSVDQSLSASVDKPLQKNIEPDIIVTHIPTPKPVKAIYMTSWVAGTKSIRDNIIKIIDETEVNSVVIDIKDATGKISFIPEDPYLKEIGSGENRIPEIKKFIDLLHKKNIYVIGRISVFQDPHLVSRRPDLAVKRKSDGSIWKDYKKISWLDVGSKEVWDYVIAIAKESHSVGFDELNFDYIRFPSDGNMSDIAYDFYGKNGISKSEQIRQFFEYLNKNVKSQTGATMSADLFGMTTTNTDDLNIGQLLENAIPYFDYIAPMVYPSHYPKTFMGFANPAEKPYEVIHFSMSSAVKRAVAASSSPYILRPWLQDFDLGADYDHEKVRAQIQATYDVGLDSWMIWSPSNRYTVEALNLE